MRNRLTFANVIGVLLENKKKTYPQHQLVRSLNERARWITCYCRNCFPKRN